MKILRKKVLKRDKGICKECNLDCRTIDIRLMNIYNIDIYLANDYMKSIGLTSFSSWHIHHIVPQCIGGTNLMDNLQTLCQWCHKKKHYENSISPTYFRLSKRSSRIRDSYFDVKIKETENYYL
jgi:5-methylcytosine-specific restriction endonuclease McrA